MNYEIQNIIESYAFVLVVLAIYIWSFGVI